MKKTFILILIAAIFVLGASFASLAVNLQLLANQDRSLSTDTGKTYPLPLIEGMPNDSTGGRDSDSRVCYLREQATNSSGNLKGEGDLNMSSSDNKASKDVNNLLNRSVPPEDVPIPGGRIFLRGEPPYGYLPTVDPKENIAIPLIPIDF